MNPGILQVFKAFIQSLGDMGDIIDMAIKANDGKTTYTIGELTNRLSTGTICSITAASTKDLYLAGASVSIEDPTNNASGAGSWQVHVLRNGATIDTWTWRNAYNSAGISEKTGSHNFKVVGAKVTTSQVFSLVLAEAGASCDVFGMLYGWQEDTGVSPQI